MDFLKAINLGLEKSEKSLAARQQVNEVFTQINNDLKQFSGGELLLERGISVMASATIFHGALMGIKSEDLGHDKLVLTLKNDAGTFTADVAGWKQRAEGFPCILKFDGQELSCSSPKQLKDGILDLFASIGFGNAVRKLMSRSSDVSSLPGSPDAAKSGTVTNETLSGERVVGGAEGAREHGGEDDSFSP